MEAGKPCENGALIFEKDNVTIDILVISLSNQIQNSQIQIQLTGSCCVFRFLRCGVDLRLLANEVKSNCATWFSFEVLVILSRSCHWL